MKSSLAAALIAAAPALLAQSGVKAAKAPAPPLLHLEGQIRHLACGTPLEFELVVSNRGPGPFPGGAEVHVAGPALNQPPHLEGLVRVVLPALAPGASQTFHLKADPVKIDCVKAQTFVATVTAGPIVTQHSPQWDREAVELKTTPPTNCSATSSFRHLPHWDPKL